MTEDTEIKASKKDEKVSVNKSRGSGKKDKPKPLTKVVIRRLPPTMTEEEFLKQIDPLPEFEFYYYVPADWSLGFDATCRAYINFKNQDDIFLFKDRFDGYVFVDNKGAEYPAVVEFAAFQGLPKNRSRKLDPKANTIETDQHYISFLEKLANEENEKIETKLEFTLQTNKDVKITSTPLLQYLANKKQERRDDRKKRFDEKKRQREEERHKKKVSIVQKVPISIKEEENRGGYNNLRDDKAAEKHKVGDRGGRGDRNNDDRKDSRKRRTERDQRRRLERENRDRERENRDRDRTSYEKKSQESKSTVSTEDKKQQEEITRKEVKKYSQSRREKMRSMSENKGNDISSNSQIKKDSAESKKSQNLTNLPSPQDEVINDTVKDFINSVAKIKNFVPRFRENIPEFENKIDDSTNNFQEINKKLENISLDNKSLKKKHIEKGENLDYNEGEKIQQSNSRRGSRSSSSANEKYEKSSVVDNRENRRIRNKDRPSIAIYQPGKLRLGCSSAEASKDSRSNPNSDCESVKPTEKDYENQKPVKKKVSRYSERRSNKSANVESKEENDTKEKSRRNSKDANEYADLFKKEKNTEHNLEEDIKISKEQLKSEENSHTIEHSKDMKSIEINNEEETKSQIQNTNDD